MTRIYTGADGNSHAQDIDVKVGPGPAGSADGPTDWMTNITTLHFRRTPPNYFVDWHTTPVPQYIVTLSGRQDIELTNGIKVRLYPGHILLLEDVTGKGHIARGIGIDDHVSVILTVAPKR